MTSLLRRVYEEELIGYAVKIGAFGVELSHKNCMLMSVDEQRRIVNEVIKPLVRASRACYVYESNPSPPISEILHRDRGRYRMDVARAFEPGLDEYWAAACGRRGTIVWICQRAWPLLDGLFARAYDPFVLANLGSVMSKSAIAFARKHVANTPSELVFALTSTNGVEWLTMFVHKAAMAECVGRALAGCTLTPEYLKRYGAS